MPYSFYRAIIVYKVPLIGNSLDRIKSLSKQSKQYQNYRLDKVTKQLISIPYLIPSFLFKLMNRGNSEPYVGISVLPMLTNLGQVAEMPVEALVTYAGVLNDKACKLNTAYVFPIAGYNRSLFY